MEQYQRTRSCGFGEEVKRRILLGTQILSNGYGQNYYGKALDVGETIREEWERIFEGVDVVIMPTTPGEAPHLGEREDAFSIMESDRYTIHANLAGLPALSLPWGKGESGLPLGLQIVGPAFGEEMLFWFAEMLERDRENPGQKGEERI